MKSIQETHALLVRLRSARGAWGQAEPVKQRILPALAGKFPVTGIPLYLPQQGRSLAVLRDSECGKGQKYLEKSRET